MWRSTDGQTWSDPEWQTTFSGGESTGRGVIAGTAVVVGGRVSGLEYRDDLDARLALLRGRAR